jgi:hypothetical protein
MAKDDMNISTPRLIPGYTTGQKETGRITESNAFGKPVDWFKAWKLGRLPLQQCEQLLNCIAKCESINFNAFKDLLMSSQRIPVRGPCTEMALDVYHAQTTCFET